MSQPRTIKFMVSARDLPMKGFAGPTKQDPYIKMSQVINKQYFKEIKSTSHRVNDPNPDYYDTVLSFDWTEGTKQILRFEVMDYHNDDVIGYADIDVDDYVLKNNEELYVKLSKSSQGSLLIKKCETVKFRLAAKNLPRLDPMDGLSDPYVKCYWSFGADGPATLFATTKTIDNVENAVWDEVLEFPYYQVGTNQYWTFKVFDKDTLSKDDYIGEASVEVDEYLKLRNMAIYNLSSNPGNISQLIISPRNLIVVD